MNRNWKEGIASFIAPPVYHGTMTVRRAAFGALVACTLCLWTACAGNQDHVLSFERGKHQAQVRDVRIDVIGARYAERQLTVECTVLNASDTIVSIDSQGVLLDDDGLEIPPLDLSAQPTEFIIPAGGSTVMRFAFAVNGLEPRMRTLGLWALRSPSAPLPPLRVHVPGIRTEST